MFSTPTSIRLFVIRFHCLQSARHRRSAWILLVALLPAFGLAQSTLPVVELVGVEDDSPRKAAEGWVSLGWTVPEEVGALEGLEFELQEATVAGFAEPQLQYRGRDTASFVAGLAEGSYFYRVRLVGDDEVGPWSEPLEVRVEYVNQGLVWTLLAAGMLGFVATAGTLFVSHRRAASARLST